MGRKHKAGRQRDNEKKRRESKGLCESIRRRQETGKQTSARREKELLRQRQNWLKETVQASMKRRQLDQAKHREKRSGGSLYLDGLDLQDENEVPDHYLGPMSHSCADCQAMHFESENIGKAGGGFPSLWQMICRQDSSKNGLSLYEVIKIKWLLTLR